MLAIELVDEKGAPNAEATSAVSKFCLENGLLFFTCGSFRNCIRFITPLNISTAVIDEGLNILEKALEKVSK